MFYDAISCYATEFEKTLKYQKKTENGKHKKKNKNVWNIKLWDFFVDPNIHEFTYFATSTEKEILRKAKKKTPKTFSCYSGNSQTN